MARQHLTLSQRIILEKSLDGKSSLRKIAREVGCSRSTIVREIKAYRFDKDDSVHYYGGFNTCVYKKTCKRVNVCPGRSKNSNIPKCTSIACGNCHKCNKYCLKYMPERCDLFYRKAPFVCTGCPLLEKCPYIHTYYSAERAHKLARERWGEAHAGANISKEELLEMVDLLEPLLKQGLSISAICAAFPGRFTVCTKTIYNYINKRIITDIKRGDMPRSCRIRPRNKEKTPFHKVNAKCRENREMTQFNMYMQLHPDANVWELDTLEGRKGGKVIITLICRNSRMMIASLVGHKNAESVVEVFRQIHKVLGDALFKEIFEVVLTDNGPEFSDPISIESLGASVFYCDPGTPQQKGRIERNHFEVRKILEKGVHFNDITQIDVNLVLSHVNSYRRKCLGWKTPFEAFEMIYGRVAANRLVDLGLKIVDFDKVTLKPSLIPSIEQQVIERAKRIVEDAEIVKKALEKAHESRKERSKI